MKRATHLIPLISDMENLELAFWKASKGKRYAGQVLAYQQDLNFQLITLQQQIQTGLVDVGNYRFFKIYDPKEREICASAIREQVLHHAIMNICHPFFERKQIDDSYACRKGKGTYAALARAKFFTKKNDFFLKLDVLKFFASIHHEVLKQQLRRMFKDTRLIEILDKIIDSYEASPNRGMPIGNLSSQYFANHFLSGLDHFIKEKLRIKAYVRYMDDMVLWHQDKKVLQTALISITDYVENQLLCELKPPIINRSRCGLPFLGYVVYPYQIRLNRRSKARFIRKMKAIEAKYQVGEWDEATCQRHALPLIAFTRHADSKALRKKICK